MLGMEAENIHAAPVTTSISTGRDSVLIVKSDGTLWGTGSNGSGQLGDGSNVNQNRFVQIGKNNNWKQVSIGAEHAAGIKEDGTLWTWGNNYFGQLGDGSQISVSYPAQRGTNTNWKKVEANQNYTLALKTDGTLYSWGSNYGTWNDSNGGQLGSGPGTVTSVITQVGTSSDWLDISAGDGFVLALKKDYTLWAWGNNVSGQLGNGTTISASTPIQIGTDRDWLQVSAGQLHGCAIKINGSLWCWGDNWAGMLGDGSYTSSKVPVQAGSKTDWKKIDVGQDSTFAIDNSGILWAFGYNNRGWYGDGSTGHSISPKKISNKVFTDVSIDTNFTVTQDVNGNVYTSGGNDYGQLGDGTVIDSHTMKTTFRVFSNLTWTEIGIKSGELTLMSPSISRNFGNVILSGSAVEVTADISSLTVGDATGTFSGYRISVKGSGFKEVGGAGYKIPSGSLSLVLPSSVTIENGNAAIAPTLHTGTVILDDNITKTIASAANTKGAGRYQINFSPNALSLRISPETDLVDSIAYPSSPTLYETTLTWSITVGP